jgi:hypothetical protein
MTQINFKQQQQMMTALAVFYPTEESFSVSCERGKWKNAAGEIQYDWWTTCSFNGEKLCFPVSFFEEASALSKAEYARWKEHVAMQQKTNKTLNGFRSVWQMYKGDTRALCLATFNELLRKSGIRIAAKTKKGNTHCNGLSVTAVPKLPSKASSFDNFGTHAEGIMLQVLRLMIEVGAIKLNAKDAPTIPEASSIAVAPIDTDTLGEESDDEWCTRLDLPKDDLESLKTRIEELEWEDDASHQEEIASLRDQCALLEAASSSEKQATLAEQKAHVSKMRQRVNEIISEVENISTKKFAPFAKLSCGGKIARVAFNKGGEDAIDELCLLLEKME